MEPSQALSAFAILLYSAPIHTSGINYRRPSRPSRPKIGTKLLQDVEQEAKEQAIRKLCLLVLSTNLAALRFYEQKGFNQQGRLVVFDQRPLC
ncbi:GNAT family N-acetyltransferase [Sediminibacillus albus]